MFYSTQRYAIIKSDKIFCQTTFSAFFRQGCPYQEYKIEFHCQNGETSMAASEKAISDKSFDQLFRKLKNREE